MRASSSLAAIALSVLTFTGAPLVSAVHAADLDGEAYVEPPYDDSGYADEAGGPDGYDEPRGDRAPQNYDAPRNYNAPRYGAAEPLPGSVKDGYPVPMPPPRYSQERSYRSVERIDRRPYVRNGCLARWEMRRSLNRDGWSRIRPMGGDGPVVHMLARRFDSSSDFDLRVDRCSGEVLAAKPRVFLRSYAYGDRPWR
jgi:hypothetical protein